jgi:DNA-binding response OmpR family regulator
VQEHHLTILVVEDDLDVADMLSAYFHIQGYQVVMANIGEKALQECRKKLPDLIVLDIRLPDIDGYEVARRLRANRRTQDIPIIFLTERRTRADRLQGLELGADDYITKPFDIQELRLRVRNALRRSTQGPLNNPVTNLPEGVLVDERLRESLEAKGWSMLMVSLDHLDAFREAYGFVASDDVLRAVGLMLQNAIHELGASTDFIGQIEPTTFLLITHSANISALQERICSRLEQSLEYFYPLKDREILEQPSDRLSVRIQQLHADQGPFADLQALKLKLLQA